MMMQERMTFMVRVLVAIFVISLAMLGTTHGATFYVSKSGSNSNSCLTAQSPGSSAKLTIAAGANCMSGSDTLLIQAGTYAESLESDNGFPWRTGTPGAYTRYARYQNDAVWVQPNSGPYRVVQFNGQQYIELDGVHINAINVQYDGIKLDGTSQNIRVKNLTVKNAKSVNIYPGTNAQFTNLDVFVEGSQENYGFYMGGSNVIVENSRIYNNGGFGIHNYNYSGGSNNNIIRNNIISGNGFRTHNPVTGAPEFYPAMITGSGVGHQVYNNVIHNNWSGIQVAYGGAANIKIYNNTIYNNTGDPTSSCVYINDDVKSTDVRNNICYQNNNDIVNNAASTTQSNNLTSNPLFVNAMSGDFHLQGGSPAIDAGVTISTVITDYDGKPRSQGYAYDIGAYEYIKGLPQPANLRTVQY